ncbi:hypothetical protein P8605_06845 [Streptomyces sp. T-3]|nr:hypothetical protein [Streptomyces sp. T-3]
MTVSEKKKAAPNNTADDPRPVDVKQVDADSAWALQIRFDQPDREAVDICTLRLTGALNLLIREDLAEDEPDYRRLYQAPVKVRAPCPPPRARCRLWCTACSPISTWPRACRSSISALDGAKRRACSLTGWAGRR